MQKRNPAHNIILIGMPAAGKSTIGVILAKILGYDFIDTDLIMQKETGQLLKDIIKERGVEGFMALENEINGRIAASRAVIATGGSAVYGTEAMRHFKEIGTVIYLKVPFDVILRRLNDIRQRGVVLREGQSLEELYRERCLLYEKYADVVIEEADRNPEDMIREITMRLNKEKRT